MARRRILSALTFYGVLFAVAVAVLFFAGRPFGRDPNPWLGHVSWLSSDWSRLGLSLVLSALVSVVVIVGTRVVVRRAHWARELHSGFRELLGPLTSGEILVFALTSGVAEELFFRAALQPWIGYFAASLVFGLVHIGPGRRFVPWTIWAVAMGFVLGGIYGLTGHVLGPMLAHVLVNYENMHFLNGHDPQAHTPSSEAPPSGATALVGARERGGASRSWH